MTKYREAFVGLGVAKLTNAIAVAEDGRDREIWYLGEVEALDVGLPLQKWSIRFNQAVLSDHIRSCLSSGLPPEK